MKAMVITAGGDLELADVDDPRPGPTELLLAVGATSVNRADLAHRAGRHDPRLSRDGPPIAGMDAAGTVIEVGTAVRDVHVGDRVMGLVGGGHAELAVLDHRLAVPVPRDWTDVDAAAAVSGLLTQHHALVRAARLRAGESVLVHGASAAVGLTAVQLAAFLGARPVLATARTARADDLIARAGADVVVHTGNEPFAERALAATGGAGVDVIVDHVGGPYLADSVRCLAVGGRLISVGRLGGELGELDLEQLAFKQARVVGVTFRTRTLEQHADIVRGVIDDLLPALDRGLLRPFVDRTYPLADATEAQAYMAADRHHGKLVLTVAPRPTATS